MKIAITGASGLIGSALTQSLETDGHCVIPISRSGGDGVCQWDLESGTIEFEKLAGCDAIVNLAGEGIAQRWTDAVKQRIMDSRVQGTRLIAQTAAKLDPLPKAFISASAIGIYGYEREAPVDEQSDSGEGFLAEVCKAWEPAAQPAMDAGMRTVFVRVGVVLSKDGGALAKMLPVFRTGMGGPIGDGKQCVSWIALDDLVAVFRMALENDRVTGPINAVAPNPVTNAEFAKAVGGALGRPAVVPAPAFTIKLAFGEMAKETVLSDVEVQSTRLPEHNFQFAYPEINHALKHVLAGD